MSIFLHLLFFKLRHSLKTLKNTPKVRQETFGALFIFSGVIFFGGGMGRSDRAGEVDHVEGGFSGLAPFVAVATSDAFDGLLLVFNGEQSEYHRSITVGVEGSHSLSDALADIVEVGGVAADDASEDDHCVIGRCFDHVGGGKCQFDRTGNVENINIAVCKALFVENVKGSVAQGVGYFRIP